MYNLLKYDFKYIWRIWWIAALASVLATIVGIFSVHRTMSSEAMPIPEYQMSRSLSGILDGLGVSGIIMFFAVIIAFVILIEILVWYRYYKNFFTDEGYLTFTLPMQENTLLMSKSISGTVVYIVTMIVAFVLLSVCGIFALSFDVGWAGALDGISRFVFEFFKDLGPYAGVYLTEIILIAIASCIFNVQLGYIAITIGSIIAKKNKLLAGVGIYFAICMAISIISNVLGTVGILNLDMCLEATSIELMMTIFLGVIIFFLVAIAVASYFINLSLLKNKLNLA